MEKIIIYIVIGLLYYFFYGRKKTRSKTPPRPIPHQKPTQSSVPKPVSASQREVIRDMRRVLKEQRPVMKQSLPRKTKPISALEEDIRYRIPQYNEETEALKKLKQQGEELQILQKESIQTHTFFREEERANFSGYKTGRVSGNRFRALLKNRRSLRDAVVLSEIIQRKYN